jgi:hypothetical protein
MNRSISILRTKRWGGTKREEEEEEDEGGGNTSYQHKRKIKRSVS